MSGIAAPLVTVEEYKLLPENGPRYQLIEGDLYMAPAPNRYHQDISRNLEFILLDYLEEDPVGKLYHAPFDVYLDRHNVFQPDIVVVLNRSLAILTEAGAEGAPEFVVEILSPKTAQLDRVQKRRVYAQAGVEELWIIAPDKQTIEVFLLRDDATTPTRIHDARARLNSTLFPGVEFDAARIFAR